MSHLLRMAVAAAIALIGVTVLLVSPWTVQMQHVLVGVGEATAITGILGFLFDGWLHRHVVDELANKLQARLSDSRPSLQRITGRRFNDNVYYEWAARREPTSLGSSGVSVLRRLSEGFEQRGIDAMDLIASKLEAGWEIRALFVDPRANDAINQIAKREGRQPA